MADTDFAAGTVIRHEWLNDVNDAVYSGLGSGGVPFSSISKFQNAGTGAVVRSSQDKHRESISVKDFGAVGTTNIANQTLDTAAFLAALATGHNVYVPEGTYYLSQTVSIGYGQEMYGAGQFKTNIIGSGLGTVVYMGSSVLTSLIYNCGLRDLTVYTSSRSGTAVGVELQNCVYFNLENLSIFGSGNPNSGVPADQILYGSGLYLHDNTIIGRISHVSCRLWNMGRYYKTDSTSQSRWTAAIVDCGQGEVANNMYGIVIGDATVALYSGVGCAFRDISIQGNYSAGVIINSGDNTIVDACYFEGNASHDIIIGTISGAPPPIGCKIINNSMSSESIGTTPYGTLPYLDKISVLQGSFNKIENNNMSISTAIPLVTVAAAAVETAIKGNRLNSTAAVSARISNASTTTITADNAPEAARVASISLTRVLDTASGSVSYTGIGFRPTSIEFTGAVDTTPERFIGWCDASSGVRNRCMTTDAAGNSSSSADCIRLIKTGAGNEQKAVLASFDADGFTLTWTKVGAPPANTLVVNFIARR